MGKVVGFPGQVHTDTPGPRATKAIGFYTLTEASRLARVPLHRLYAWRREGILAETIETIDAEGNSRLGYTFEALHYLRLIRRLRDWHVPLEKAVKAVRSLRERFGPPSPDWADVRIFELGGEVYVDRKDAWQTTVATRRGQKVANELMGDEFEQLRLRADGFLVPPEFQPYLEIDPAARSGLPIVRGTTIPTGLVYRLRRAKRSYRQILDDYPVLTLDHIKAAVRFEQLLDAEAA